MEAAHALYGVRAFRGGSTLPLTAQPLGMALAHFVRGPAAHRDRLSGWTAWPWNGIMGLK